MHVIKNVSRLLIVALFFIGCLPSLAGDKPHGITEEECLLKKNAEILWDLRRYRWICCIPDGPDLETCMTITDKEPLPKTSAKPLPPAGSSKTTLKSNTDTSN